VPETYTYSADGLRRVKVNCSGTTQFVWDEENVLLETSATGVTQARYTDQAGLWGYLTSQSRSGTRQMWCDR
jgi:hypothetical protein